MTACGRRTPRIAHNNRPCINFKDGNTPTLAALAVPLARGRLSSSTVGDQEQRDDASHLCHNKMCVNPANIVFESRKLNINRCRNSVAFVCECEPRCIWVLDGRFLPCRNDASKRVCDDGCELRCFGKLNFIYIRFLFSLFAEHALNKINLAVNQKAEDDDDLASQSEDEEPANKSARVGNI